MRRNIPEGVKEEYLNWLLTPPGEREPSSKKAFAEENDVSYRTLYYWEEEEDFQEAQRKIKTKWGARWHGDILGRLMSIVAEGSDAAAVSASKVLLQHLHIPDDVRSQKEELNDDQKALIRELMEAAGYRVLDESD